MKAIETKWQKIWEENGYFNAEIEPKKPKYYVLEMFPYPSGKIHMGHVRNYTLGDVVARFKKAQGHNVLHPMGWDAFGLPAENAARENKLSAASWTEQNIAGMRRQLRKMGFAYDWRREFATCDSDYYRHEQEFFLRLLKRGLVYRRKAAVNWDPLEKTVLANEQVIDGRGWRSGATVERRSLTQWFLRTRDYAEQLLKGLDGLDSWPERVRTMQKNWLGRSSGTSVKFKIKGSDEEITVFTTRAETLFGAAFCALAPDHPFAERLAAKSPKLREFIKKCNQLSEERLETAEKEGFATGYGVIHPFDETVELPLYVANFVLSGYGSGAVFGCPAHDQRDYDFAKRYKLPITQVVENPEADVSRRAWLGDGILINSAFLNGFKSAAARDRATRELEMLGRGGAMVNWRLRDWSVSRQRRWGCPIPVLHCRKCGMVPMAVAALPLPPCGDDEEKRPPTKCPRCKGAAEYETDTLDTFFESSWYFARFTDPWTKTAFNDHALRYWLPVDTYIGGVEHAVLHLLYSRFFMRALKADYENLPTEPFVRLVTQGMVLHPTYKNAEGKWLKPEQVIDKDGELMDENGSAVTRGRLEKMSKSRRNVVDPDEVIAAFGADAARLFILSDSPPQRDLIWSKTGIEGASRYLAKLERIAEQLLSLKGRAEAEKPDEKSEDGELRKSVAKVTEFLEAMQFNRAVAELHALAGGVGERLKAKRYRAAAEGFAILLRLLNPIAPHLSEELWQRLGNRTPLAVGSWPKADAAPPKEEKATLAVQINGKLRATIELPTDCPEDEARKRVLRLERIKTSLQTAPKRVIYIPNKVINIVS